MACVEETSNESMNEGESSENEVLKAVEETLLNHYASTARIPACKVGATAPQ